MNIYVVIGTMGEYSNRTEWVIRAYTDENRAKEHVVKATERSREIYNLVENDDDACFLYENGKHGTNDYDPNYEEWQSNEERYYFYKECELV